MKEGEKIKEILRALPDEKRLFRINSGIGWVSNKFKRIDNKLIMENPRPLQAGPEGWPDLCGWETVEITQDMVGTKVAVFVFEEVKMSGDLSPGQKKFRNIIGRMGGIFRVHYPS